MKKNIMYRFISWIGIIFLFLGINIGFSDYIHNSGYDTSETISNSDQTIANKGARYTVDFIYREYSETYGDWIVGETITINNKTSYEAFFTNANTDMTSDLKEPGIGYQTDKASTHGPYPSKSDSSKQYQIVIVSDIKKELDWSGT